MMSAQVVADSWRLNCWRMISVAVASGAKHRRLIERDPLLNAIAEMLEKNVDVFSVVVDDEWIRPTAQVHDVHWQIPMVDCHQRLDTFLQKPIDEFAVEFDAFHVELRAVGQDSSPGN